jgi:hypothetical protein
MVFTGGASVGEAKVITPGAVTVSTVPTAPGAIAVVTLGVDGVNTKSSSVEVVDGAVKFIGFMSVGIK